MVCTNFCAGLLKYGSFGMVRITRALSIQLRNLYLRSHQRISDALKKKILKGGYDTEIAKWNESTTPTPLDAYMRVLDGRKRLGEHRMKRIRLEYKNTLSQLTRTKAENIIRGDYDFDVLEWHEQQATQEPEDIDFGFDDTGVRIGEAFYDTGANHTDSVWGNKYQKDRMTLMRKQWDKYTSSLNDCILRQTDSYIIVASFTGRPYTHMVMLGSCTNPTNPGAGQTKTVRVQHDDLLRTSPSVPHGWARRYLNSDDSESDQEPVMCTCEDFWYRAGHEAKNGCKHMWFYRALQHHMNDAVL